MTTTTPTPITAQVADLADGTRIPFVRHGAVGGPAAFLLHGLSDSWRSYREVLPLLPDDIDAVAPTFRGHGDADRPPAGYSLAGLAGDVVEVLDRLGIERTLVVGHSLGASVALRVATDHPGRVSGLVLAAAFATPGANPGALEVAEIADAMSDPVDPGFVAEFQRSTVARPVADSFLDDAIAESCKLPARVWQETIRGYLADEPLDLAAGVTVPTLLVWGDADAFVPRADQDALLGAIDGAELTVYEGTGHALFWEEPARFADDVGRFVAAVAR